MRALRGSTFIPWVRIEALVYDEVHLVLPFAMNGPVDLIEVHSMDVADLKVFEAVARHGSMNRAAAELHTVQSNVTARIRALEREIGVALFHRHVRGVSLTPAGQRMLPYAARMTKLLADAKLAALDDGPPSGTLALGTLETTAALRLSPILSNFARVYPQVRLSLTTGTSCSLTEDVAECRLDGAFVAGPVDHPDLHAETIFEEELVLVTPRTVRSVDALPAVKDLKTIVFRLGCSYRQRLEALLAEMGIVTATPLEFGSLDAIIACVAAGIGITLLPRGVVTRAAEQDIVAVHPVAASTARVSTLFIRRHDAYVSSAMQAFVEVARSGLGPVVMAAA
ncbi:DNA-binding transcriptional regulator, LysR family [Paraburkholderia diazotrophica]|uniref:DNA-binding transcriptional regulator, LysR family n=2 Tax=Paraburkholderia diazotrophica TaxID=667676 RepID=A0A1H7EDV7_9BURK|nr:DNA-binding transcriptional regulator, LysR family [Paraburkholderia diazotrophica]